MNRDTNIAPNAPFDWLKAFHLATKVSFTLISFGALVYFSGVLLARHATDSLSISSFYFFISGVGLMIVGVVCSVAPTFVFFLLAPESKQLLSNRIFFIYSNLTILASIYLLCLFH